MRRGFTLLEVIMVALISSLILLAFTEAVLVSTRTEGNVAVVSDLENDANEALQRVADQLRESGLASSGWSLGENMVTFSTCTGGAGGSKTWDTTRLLALSPFCPGEDNIWDGVDNNGNGLTDESKLVLTYDVNGTPQQEDIVSDVASGGLVLSQDDYGNITATLTLKRLNPDGVPMAASASTVISPRNWH